MGESNEAVAKLLVSRGCPIVPVNDEDTELILFVYCGQRFAAEELSVDGKGAVRLCLFKQEKFETALELYEAEMARRELSKVHASIPVTILDDHVVFTFVAHDFVLDPSSFFLALDLLQLVRLSFDLIRLARPLRSGAEGFGRPSSGNA